MGKARPWGASFPPPPGQAPASSVHLWGRGPGASILRFIPGHLQPRPSPRSAAAGVGVAPPERGWRAPCYQMHSPRQNKLHPLPPACWERRTGAQPATRVPGARGGCEPCSKSYKKTPRKQRTGKRGPDVLNPSTRPRNLEEFPGVPGVPHARHPAAGDARAGGYLISTSCESRREARPPGTVGRVRGDVCQDGGTGLGAVSGHVAPLPGQGDGTAVQRELDVSLLWSLIPIFCIRAPFTLGIPFLAFIREFKELPAQGESLSAGRCNPVMLARGEGAWGPAGGGWAVRGAVRLGGLGARTARPQVAVP